MRRVAVVVLLSIAVAMAADKNKPSFAPGSAASHSGHQTSDKITIAAVPYITSEQAATVFGKAKPYNEGILPILVIIDNGTGKALRLDLKAQLVMSDSQHIDPMPPDSVTIFHAIKRNPAEPRTSPLPPIPRAAVKKGPLNTPEIEGRAFSLHLVPAGESANGFFYFESQFEPGAKLYLTGIKDAASGQDYLYFEIPLEKPAGYK